MGHLLKIKCVDSRVNVHILASASVTFTLTTVQVPILALTHKKRITVHAAEKLCCEWTILFIFIVTDTQRRLIAALSLMKEGKNPPNEFSLYSVHRNHVE
jgi:hypothetical protein